MLKVIIEFTLGFQETRKKINPEISKELYDWRRKLKPYKTGEQVLALDFYRLTEENELFNEIVEFAKCFPDEILLKVYEYIVEYDDNDIKEAVAFIPVFSNHWCQEYDDLSLQFEECKYCYAKLSEESKRVYIMPKGFVKNKAGNYGVLRLDDEIDRFMILPLLYEKVISEGIEAKYFRPVYSKNKKVLAYELISDNILPEQSLVDSNYLFKAKCKMCGTLNYEKDKKQFFYAKKLMTDVGVQDLKDVNNTKEYFHHQPRMIISRKLHDIIKKYDATAQFYPIFLK